MHVLIGGAGAPNFGDELIVKNWIHYLCKDNEKCSPIVFEENIKKNSENFHVSSLDRYQNVSFSDLLATLAKSRNSECFWTALLRGYSFLENKGLEVYGKEKFAHLINAETLHLHGGGYLNQSSIAKGFYIGVLAAIAKMTGARLVATGIGFLPQKFPEQKQLGVIQEAFSIFDVFECRDIESYRFIADVAGNPTGLLFGLDDIYLSNVDQYRLNCSPQKNLHLSFISYNVESFTEEFWNRLSKFATKFDRVYFWESYPWQDKKVFDLVKRKIIGVELLPVVDLVYGSIPFSPRDFVICARFHVHFFGARVGASGYYHKDTKYYDVKHGSIKDRGSAFREFSSSTVFEYFSGVSSISRFDSIYQNDKKMLADYIYDI